jgi:hypothetical protein
LSNAITSTALFEEDLAFEDDELWWEAAGSEDSTFDLKMLINKVDLLI